MPSTSMPNLTLEAAPVDSAVLPLLVADGLLAFEPERKTEVSRASHAAGVWRTYHMWCCFRCHQSLKRSYHCQIWLQ